MNTFLCATAVIWENRYLEWEKLDFDYLLISKEGQ
jgi:hypothetical protein